MASIRKRTVKRQTKSGEKTYTYWVVDYSAREDGQLKRKQKHFQDRKAAELFKAEIERKLARARYAGVDADLGPRDAGIQEWVDRFMVANRPNWSDGHESVVFYILRPFIQFLAEKGVHSTKALQREHFSKYAEHELGRGLKRKSVSNTLQIIKQAVTWGIDEGIMDERLGRGFPSVKVPRNKRRILSGAEIEALLELFEGDPLYPVVLTALLTGIRRGELVQLQCEHVDLEAGVIELPGDITKNGKPRSIGIHERLQPVLEKLAEGRDGPLFTRRGEPLKPDYVSRHFSREIANLDGLDGVTFHCLRHTCATRLAAGGMSPFNVQRVMGHADIKTTMIYVNLADDEPPDMNVL